MLLLELAGRSKTEETTEETKESHHKRTLKYHLAKRREKQPQQYRSIEKEARVTCSSLVTRSNGETTRQLSRPAWVPWQPIPEAQQDK